MPDLPTVATSIGLTLAIQGGYFSFIKLPGQIRRSIATLDRLKTREIAANRIYRNVRKEVRLAYEEFAEWKSELSLCLPLEEGKLVKRGYFRDVLPTLTSRLGRMQGLLTSTTTIFSTDPLPDFIWLFEQARRVSKTLISYQKLSETDLEFELSDIQMVESRLTARIDQMTHEVDILQADLHLEISNLQAEIEETKMRFTTVSLFFSLIVVAMINYWSEKYFRHIGLREFTSSLLSVICAWPLVMGFYYLSVKYYASLVKKVERITLQEESTSEPILTDKSGSTS
jgi:hypothetical protein